MSLLRSTIAVFRFEVRRSTTLARLACWLVLVLFPPSIFGLLVYGGVPEELEKGDDAQQAWVTMIYVLIPTVITLLGLLLWATPTIHTELEGKTWIYLAVRPYGKYAVLLGKYFAAICWSALAAWLGLNMSLVILAWAYELEGVWKIWRVMNVLIGLSSFAYGALYSFIGVMMRRRAMVTAVAFTLLFEWVAGTVPALVKKFTVQYRLRSLLASWMDYDSWRESGVVGDEPVWLHLLILAGYTLALLIASATVLRLREHITADDSC